MIISRTPFRISFFGGGTDFPEFYEEHGGAVLVTAIDKYCYLSIHNLSPFFKHRFRASYAKTESVLTPSEFEHPLIRECLLHLAVQQGLEISHVADLPGRTGLGSSSSFTVGLLHALYAFMGRDVTAEDLAREAIIVERERVKDVGGHQDQYAAAYGGFIRIDFGPGPTITVRRVPIRCERVRELESRLMLFYLGIEQAADHILTEQKQRTAQNIPALRAMCQMVDTAERIVTGNDNIDAFGSLLHEAWQTKKSLSSGISNHAIDNVYLKARDAGAVGGKLLGAGGRGFLLVFAPPDIHSAIRQSLSPLQEVRFKLAPGGSEIIFNSPSS
jgi:D-glycero-alpha-D-manno-heptose-7-phosphate kinase